MCKQRGEFKPRKHLPPPHTKLIYFRLAPGGIVGPLHTNLKIALPQLKEEMLLVQNMRVVLQGLLEKAERASSLLIPASRMGSSYTVFLTS